MVKIYKLILLTGSWILFAATLPAQTNVEPNTRTAAMRYKQDFEIKGIAHPDNALLSKIDIKRFDYLRQADVRVEAKDAENNIIIILYSENEIAKMKQEHLRKASGIKTVSDVKNVSTHKIER